MLAVLALTLLAQQLGPCGVDGPIYCGGPSYAFFEFAPSTSAGLTGACACSAVTGAKGEPMTFTRASSGTCLKGNTTSSIANGDLVTCSTDQPRVMPGGDGTGGLGLLIEEARTNDALRSQELENAAWTPINFGGPAVPTVTANQAVAPDGTTSAERLQVPAAGVGTYSLLSQGGIASAARVGSLFVKGNAQSGTLHVIIAGLSAFCVACAYNSTTWTRCVTPAGASITNIYVGNDDLDCGGGAQGAKDVFVWGAQVETGAFGTSYIATTAAAATRALDAANLPASMSNTTASIAATVVTDHTALTAGQDYGIVTLSAAGPAWKQVLDYDQVSGSVFISFSTGASTSILESLVANSPLRWVAWWDGSSRNVIRNNGGSASGAAPTPTATTLIEIGQYGGLHQPGFVIKRVCVDPSTTRCR